MKSQENLIRHLKYTVKVLRTTRLEDAFRAIDRAYFVRKEFRGEAYQDYPLPIGFNATISQPTTVAFMLEKLDAAPGQKVLDIGSGSGWTTALLSYLVGPRGRVIGLEIVPELMRLGFENLRMLYSNVPQNIRIEMGPIPEIRLAEKDTTGLPHEAPFDRILVSAAAKKLPPGLVEQLTVGGRIVIPIGEEGSFQSIFMIDRSGKGKIESQEFPGFMFVPLLS